MIPKKIHQTYSSIKDLSPELHLNIEKIKSLNSGWDYFFYSDADQVKFISDYGEEELRLFQKINPAYKAARADFFRYLLMYKQGGVYLDIKSTTNRPLDKILKCNDTFILSTWNNGRGQKYENWGIHPEDNINEFQQWYIAASPNHPYLCAVVKSVLKNISNYSPFVQGVGRIGVLKTTGPIPYTKAIIENFDPKLHREVDITETGLQYSIFSKDALRRRSNHYSVLRSPVVNNSRLNNLIAATGIGGIIWQRKKC